MEIMATSMEHGGHNSLYTRRYETTSMCFWGLHTIRTELMRTCPGIKLEGTKRCRRVREVMIYSSTQSVRCLDRQRQEGAQRPDLHQPY